MSKVRIGRRHLLRGAGLGAVAIALPPLEAMFSSRGLLHGEALAGGSTHPARMIVVTFPFGTMLEMWTPPTTGTGWTIPSTLEPLAPRIDEIAVLSGLSSLGVTGGLDAAGHNKCPPALLTAVEPQWIDTVGEDADKYSQTATSASGPSVDHVAGQAIGQGTKVPNLVIHTHPPNTGEVLPLSWAGPGTPTAAFSDPRLLFDFLFADLEVDPQAAAALAARRGSVLDYVMEDIQRLQPALGSADRARLDEHLTAIEELELAAGAGISAQCVVPETPGEAGQWTGDAQGEVRTELLMDLAAMALHCDLTRSLVFAIGNGHSNPTFPFVTSDPYHNLSHWNNIGNPVEYAAVGRWFVSQLARLLDQLDALPQGDGTTLLDHAAIACTSELGDGASHSSEALPTLVAGRLGGTSLGGQHLAFPYDVSYNISNNHPTLAQVCGGSGAPRPIADLWLTMLESVGADVGSFGDSTGPISGLWI